MNGSAGVYLQLPGSARLSDGQRQLDAGAIGAEAARLAAWIGRHPAKVVAVMADNGIAWTLFDLACRLAGRVAVPLPGFFTDSQLEHVLNDCGAGLVITDQPERVAALAIAVPVEEAGPLAGFTSFWLEPRFVREIPSGTIKVTYTSGTTGQPRGVCLGGDAIDAVAASLGAIMAAAGIERHLCVLPLATLLENVAGVLAPLRAGLECIVPPLVSVGLHGAASLDVQRLLAAIDSHAAHSLILLPQMLQALVTTIENGARAPVSLRFIAVGGARVAEPLLQRAARLGLPVFEGYGLSECASVVALNRPGSARPGSVGRPLPHLSVRIAEDDEILVRGPAMRGYLGEPGIASAELATGDLGHVDDDGFLYVHGRKKNMFITAWGRNVSPEWVESELTASGPIAQAAVFGESRPWNVAVIVPSARRPDHFAIDGAIRAANERLPDYARVTAWIEAEEPFSAANGLVTANGRLRRDAIEARYAARIDVEQHARRIA